MRLKPLTIFYLITFYVFLQFSWWTYLLIVQYPERLKMWMGEGSVFLIILTAGAIALHKALKRQLKSAQQQKNFLLSVTHELKSPIASITLYIETLLKRELEKDKQKNFLENSLKEANRLDSLVENVLIATKIDNNSYSFPKETFSLTELFDDLEDRYIKAYEQKYTFEFRIDSDCDIQGDRFTLGIAINNLIENAIKYSPNGGKIEIELKKNQHSVTITVKDWGLGIPDAEKNNVFKRFYRIGNEETRNTKGTGLGLFIVKNIIDRHLGLIHIENNIPKGSIFIIELPTK